MAVILTIITWTLIIFVSYLVQRRKRRQEDRNIVIDGLSHQNNK